MHEKTSGMASPVLTSDKLRVPLGENGNAYSITGAHKQFVNAYHIWYGDMGRVFLVFCYHFVRNDTVAKH